MVNKDITFAEVSRSLNRLEGFINDMLLNVHYYNESLPNIEESITRQIEEVKFNRNGDESINYIGIHNCVDYILNNQSMLLAKRAFSIEKKINEIERILLSYIDKLLVASDLLWETGLILHEIRELYIEPFIQELDEGQYPKVPDELKWLFNNESECYEFIRKNYRKSPQFIANAYMEWPKVADPSIKNNSLHPKSTLFKYFVEPFIDDEKKKESARTGFYRLFK